MSARARRPLPSSNGWSVRKRRCASAARTSGGGAPAFDAVDVSFKSFERALDTLRALPPGAKGGVMDACEKAILADGEILEAEENLLAAVADGMDAAGYATLL